MAAQPRPEKTSADQSPPHSGRWVLRLWQRRSVLLFAGLIVAVFIHFTVFGGLAVVFNNLGTLLEVQGLLQPDGEGRQRDELLTQGGYRFQEALRWNPGSAWAYHNLGLIYLAWGQKMAAQEAFEQAVRLMPRSQPAHFQLGRLYAEGGQEDRAIAPWREAGATLWLVREGLGCQGRGDFVCAERYYEMAIGAQPDSAEAAYRLAVLLSSLGREAEAADAYQRALRLESQQSPRRYLIEARIRALEGQWAEAIAAYQRAIALNAYDAEPYEQVGIILQRQLEQAETAVEWYQAAITIDPQRLGPYLRLAELRKMQQDYPQAEHWYQQALDVTGDNLVARAEVQAGLSRCALEQGKLEEARQAAEATVEARPEVAAYHVLLGDVYAEAGQYRPAIDSYRAALELDPGNRRAERQLKELGWQEP